jgi:tRNA-uridine 2-sulfurtransferase
MTPDSGLSVAVALSGGVDSAVAAALLLQQGLRPQGVHLRLCDDGPPAGHLKALAQALGFRLTEIDLREEFGRQVVDYFVAEYLRGRTPNPCVRCNAAIKFGRLWEWLQTQGVARLATGHYARLQAAADGVPGLYRGLDRRKDQSYFLSRLPRELLPHLLFPLGEMTKTEVRRRYQELGLPVNDRCPESVELCFIPRGSYQDFIRARRGPGTPGDLVDLQGRLLGRHRGLEHYTVGQRRGLGLPAREPYYVAAINPETNRVVLGHRQEIMSPGLVAVELNWLIDPPTGELEAQAVIRYRHPGVAARITPLNPATARVIFATPQSAVAPGQAVVFYDERDRVLAGGWIEERMK